MRYRQPPNRCTPAHARPIIRSMEPNIIPPAAQVKAELREALKRVKLLKALLKIAEDAERPALDTEPEDGGGDGQPHQ